LAQRLVELDDRLWLSRSWTTRPKRATERGDEYVFVDRSTFESAIDDDRFLEWAEFQGNLYGTPQPSSPSEADVLLEIEVQGAEQVRRHNPDSAVFLILPPSMDDLEARLRGRGDSPEHVAQRLASTPYELARGHELADFVIVNDEVDRAASEILSILEELRRQRRNPPEKD
jgi:guanylate kinase